MACVPYLRGYWKIYSISRTTHEVYASTRDVWIVPAVGIPTQPDIRNPDSERSPEANERPQQAHSAQGAKHSLLKDLSDVK